MDSRKKTDRGRIDARLFIGCLALIVLLPLLTSGQTLTSQKVLGRYQQFIWLEEHGLPQNTVQAITRTRDGYLWLGTQAGAARFDGVRFTVFDNTNTNEIKSSLITALLEDAAGNLWLGTDGTGLNRMRDGRFSLYTTREGLPEDHVRALPASYGLAPVAASSGSRMTASQSGPQKTACRMTTSRRFMKIVPAIYGLPRMATA